MKFTGLLDRKDVEIDESSPSGSEYELADAEESESSGPLSDDDKDDDVEGLGEGGLVESQIEGDFE